MTVSHAMLHRAEVEANRKDAERPAYSAAHDQNYRAFNHKLKSDLSRLNQIPSKMERKEVKRLLVPEYDEYIQPILTSGKTGKNNDVFAWVLVWCVDAGLLDQAMKMLAVALVNELTPPRMFTSRKLPEIVVEDISVMVIEHQTPEMFKDYLLELEAITKETSFPDYIRAKLYRAMGQAVMKQSAPDAAEWFAQSVEYNPKGGAKALLKTCRKLIDAPVKKTTRRRSRDTLKHAPDDAKTYDLSVRQAAELLGVSYQTFLKIADDNKDTFSVYEVAYGKGTMKRYKSKEIKAYRDKHITRSKVMTTQTIQHQAMHDSIFGELQCDLHCALKLVQVKPENIMKATNLVDFWMYHQVKNAGIDFSEKTNITALQPLLEALRSKNLLGEFEPVSGAIRLGFEELFPKGEAEKLLNYIADKFLTTLMEYELIEFNHDVYNRVLDFEYPDPPTGEKRPDVKTDC